MRFLKPRDHDKGFRPDRDRGFRWAEEIGEPECPYMTRWVANFGPFAIRLHHWTASDDDRHLHDHGWWFWTLILKGGYTDVTEAETPGHLENWRVGEHLRPGSIRYRPATHTHTVQVDEGGCWSLLITGPRERDWGFHTPEGWIRMRGYFKRFGHHPCEDGR